MTVSLWLICVLLLVFIILQHITITAERDLIKSYKNTVEEFNQTINSLQDNYTDLMIEKHQLQNNFNFISQKKLDLETRVKDLTAEKDQLQRSVGFLSQKKLELETRVKDLTAEKDRLQRSIESLNKKNMELESKVTSLSLELNMDASGRVNREALKRKNSELFNTTVQRRKKKDLHILSKIQTWGMDSSPPRDREEKVPPIAATARS
ncbi:CD209 antigen-like protein [Labeo rohita]|uniref:CD209 antigen-like protein n=1 Tax=Labeo rohita TaxID=84645 RepID=A0A498MIR8_LABRO|nr:CD209 antigen-like protein [Labeo rohita]